jgi:hypothetical protein
VLCRLMCALLFLAWTAERNGDPLLFNGHWRSFMAAFAPLFDSLPIVHQPAWNVLLVVVGLACVAMPGGLRRRAWPMDGAILVSLAGVATSFAWGVWRGGDAYWGYYQINALVIGLFAGYALVGAIRSPADLDALMVTIVAAALVRSSLALYYFSSFVYGRPIYPAHITSHDDSPLFVVAALVLANRAIISRRWRPWVTGAVLLVPILLAIKVNNRRMAWFELAFALGFTYLVLPPGRFRRKANRWLMVLVPVLTLYVAVGWGRAGAIFAPLRAFDTTTGTDEDASTLARKEEDLNLVVTYLQHPIVGSGWGHRFTSVSSYFANFGGGFDELYGFTPHNSLTALVAFTGLVGYFTMMGVMPVTAFLAARAHRYAGDPSTRTATSVALCIPVVFGLHALGDLGMQTVTAQLLLSVALGIAGRTSIWTGAWPQGRRRRRRVRSLPSQSLARSASSADGTRSASTAAP